MKIEQHLLIFIFGPFLPQERLNFLQQRIKCSLDLDHCPFDNEKYRSQVECPICTRLRLLLLILQLPNSHRLGRFEVCNSTSSFPPSLRTTSPMCQVLFVVSLHTYQNATRKKASPPCWDVSPACGGRSCCLVTREKVVRKPCVPFADVCMKSACLLKSHVPTRMKRALCT